MPIDDISRRHLLKLLGAGVAAAAVPTDAAGASLRLIDRGTSSYAICVSQDASAAERHGAAELQRFFLEMSGARLPILADSNRARGELILVGRSSITDELEVPIQDDVLGAEGFVLKTAGRRLVLAGGRPRGTLYAVYTFLDQLGCRWFTPEVSRIPRVATIDIEPLDEIHKPAFEYREPFQSVDRDWCVRNKVNGSAAGLDASVGGRVQYYPWAHSFYQMIPPDKYFEDHPEYFSLIDGRRRANRGQLCLTNPDVLRLSIDAVFGWIRERPEVTILSVSQNDWATWCECDNCRRVEQEEGGAHIGPILRFVNAIAAAIEKQYPDKLIDTLAYEYSEDPPSTTRPRPNVRIRLCPIGACEAHPYETCPYNARVMQNLKAWSKMTDQLYVWHYMTNYSHWLLPFPNFDELAADIPMYRRHGVKGLFVQGVYTGVGGGENADLRRYVTARLLWNPATDVQRDIDEFHHAYYGKAARSMRRSFDLLHGLVRLPPAGEGQHIWIRRAPHLSDATVSRVRRLFRQADASAEDDTVRRRVGMARLTIDEAELFRAKRFDVRGDWYAPRDLEDLNTRFATFMADLRRYGITGLAEGRVLADEERDFAARIRPYRVHTLENAVLRVRVAPALNGRVIEMMAKPRKQELLRRADPDELSYPARAGVMVAVRPDRYGTTWDIAWEVDAGATRDGLLLIGRCANGLVLERRMRLVEDRPFLSTHTRVRNDSTGSLDVILEAPLQPNVEGPGNVDARLRFRAQTGVAVDMRLLGPGLAYLGAATYSGDDLPHGEWQVENRAAGLTVVNRFRQAHVEACTATWLGRGENRVILSVWSPKYTLQAGQTVEFEADYGF
jgi:uncharacterized protein DUF4838/glycosyl hydrolase family 67